MVMYLVYTYRAEFTYPKHEIKKYNENNLVNNII